MLALRRLVQSHMQVLLISTGERVLSMRPHGEHSRVQSSCTSRLFVHNFFVPLADAGCVILGQCHGSTAESHGGCNSQVSLRWESGRLTPPVSTSSHSFKPVLTTLTGWRILTVMCLCGSDPLCSCWCFWSSTWLATSHSCLGPTPSILMDTSCRAILQSCSLKRTSQPAFLYT